MRYEEHDFHDSKLMEWKDDEGKLHREDGPAYIKYYHDGRIYESFWLNDTFHRRYGPARIWTNKKDPDYYEDEYWHLGLYLGKSRDGFWKLWDFLNEEERKNPDILKLIASLS
jgi:hypothetical protein